MPRVGRTRERPRPRRPPRPRSTGRASARAVPARIDVRVHPVVLAPHFPFTERPHGHIVCRSCGRIATVSFAAEEEVLLERFAARRPPGWFVEGITYSLTGLCRRCHEAQPG